MRAPSEQRSARLVARILATAVVSVICTSVFAAEASTLTEEQQTLYAIGVSMSRSLSVFDLSSAEFEYIKQGLTDAQNGKVSEGDFTSYSGRIQELAKSRRKASGEKQVAVGKDFLEKAAKEKGAVKTPSGMVYTPVAEGKGESPKSTDVVTVHYRGTLVNGKEFDSSYKRGKPLEFRLDNVISCWVEGVQKMKPGGKAKLVCPPNLAYGDNGAGELILPGATLAFDIELLETKPATPPGAGSAAPPSSAAPAAK
jgi:FKBP-type peptidyl-prolyl cis-trans isomerase FkpA